NGSQIRLMIMIRHMQRRHRNRRHRIKTKRHRFTHCMVDVPLPIQITRMPIIGTKTKKLVVQ
ncbi:MAG: hypothetical protein L3J31_04635, partial [Bacteroidales bacterium]|nr:hypothetical protein [Bacteroidales bacterium]